MNILIRDEKGNASIFLLWLLGIVALLFVIIINITKVFLVGSEASYTAQQAALAGSSVYIKESKAAIEEFDNHLAASIDFRLNHGGKSLGELVNDKQDAYEGTGLSTDQAYIKALNDVLPSEISSHILLKNTFKDHLQNSYFSSSVFNAVQSIINDSEKTNPEDTSFVLSDSEWRLEVKSSVTFKSIASERIPFIKGEIPANGHGPKLIYLENVYE
ncbi:Putative Flp pilus-assembly TadE/G-like [Salinibacillus kushneri]|uniref:Putative Flp pilus-assembly TadE/G-like n=1 Tax=Salinibacillus kushneri TaxID=237682 RepID=A0A1I0J6B5_9BACI|nr:Tad domain-containing protein [Salinibacillus kushneri]SEU05332.1 Putative Flp pilus-assembly TadE/G-like [Salinibacillus kushneri]